ncbi:MAG TPA: DUF4279 domain-containing protein, partial [Polyangiaceae bacterium]|nr:DUF4279 domain-containing protein [Polyangiaceae bacterium]
MTGEIARSEFVAIDETGTERPVRVVLRAPELTVHGDWACVIDPDLLVGGPPGGIVGRDAIQAMSLALAFVRRRLTDFRDGGGRIVFDGEARVDVPLDAQFGSIGDVSAPAAPLAYEDDYASCAVTYATLRIFSDELTPDHISGELGIQPTRSFRRGEPISPRVERPRPEHGWLLCTDGLVSSRDTRRHIDWLLDNIGPKAEAFGRITNGGSRSDIYSFWVSARGQGGP